MTSYSVVGRRMTRADAIEKVTGTAIYSGDVALPRMLYGRVLRSPHVHAAIRRLDTTKAQALQGVLGVITAADVPGYEGRDDLFAPAMPHLARTKVVFDGQPVAAVAATDPHVAEEALSLIDVEYEELAPLLDVMEARQPDAPLIYPNLYTRGPSGKDTAPSNVALRVLFERGDVEAGFREADLVIENTFRTQTVHQGYMEPQAALASVDLSGKVTVWTQSQGIFHIREALSSFLKLPLSRIRVVPMEVGGAFGGKTYYLLSPLCALLALKIGRPVRMEMSREEVLRASRPAPDSVIAIKMGATREGRLTAAAATMIFNAGAFPERPYCANAALTGLSLYNIPNLRIEGLDVLTNQVPSGAYRAPAAPQSAFAVESQIDLFARELGMDPLEIRMKNAVARGDLMTDGTALPTIGFRETLQRAAEYVRQRGKPEGENRGRGIACGFWRGGVGCTSALVNVNADGSVNLLVGCIDLTGSRTSLAQIAAEEFGIPFEKVSVFTGDTDTAPYSELAVGSKTTYIMGMAVYQACQDAKRQIARLAAARLGVEAADIELGRGRIQVRGEPDRSLSLADVALASVSTRGDGPITGRGSVGMPPHAPMFAVHIVDLEVERDTGRIKILSYAAAQDVGLAINPTLIEGQIQGGITQGIGWALMEQYRFDQGVVQNRSLLDYRMPTATDVPPVDILLVEVASDLGPYGMRPVGEPPIVPTLGAIANAIHDAVGVRLKELPLTPEALLQAQLPETPPG